MKKAMMFIVGLLLLTACSSENEWKASISTPPVFLEEQASTFQIEIVNEDDEPVSNLAVAASFEMEKMDHGTIDVTLQSLENGIYEGSVTLPMEGKWQIFLEVSDGNNKMEEVLSIDVQKRDPSNNVASINGQEITSEDIAFYQLINQLQIEMYREKDKETYSGEQLEQAMRYWDNQLTAAEDKNTLLTQIIRLRAAALLAEEKGHTASVQEIEEEIEAVKEIYAKSPIATELIQQFGEEKFWNIQKEQYELIVLTSKVQQDVMDLVKEANPEAETQELNMLAQKKYEELLVSQVSTLDIQIN